MPFISRTPWPPFRRPCGWLTCTGPSRGVHINWTKSLLFPVSQSPLTPPPHIPLTSATKFRYLDIEIQTDISSYLTNNVYSILQQLTCRYLAWKTYPWHRWGGSISLKWHFSPKFCMYLETWWFTQSRHNPSAILEAAILGSYSALSNLVFRGLKAHVAMTTPMCTTTRVWEKITAKLNPPNTLFLYSALGQS